MKRLLLILGAASVLAAAQAHADATAGRDAGNDAVLSAPEKPLFPRPHQPKSDAAKAAGDRVATDIVAGEKAAGGAPALPAVEGLTFEQLLVLFPDLTKEKFTQADADGDGVLSEAERESARAAGTIPS